jgi:hypothetical protein
MKRRKRRPDWMIREDPVAMRRREQRRLGFDVVKLDSLSACKLVYARLDDQAPSIVIDMCLQRFRRRHSRTYRTEDPRLSLSFLKPHGRGAYLWREEGVWIFAFPRRKQRGPTEEQVARDFDIVRLDDPAQAEAAAQRLTGSDTKAVIEMCLTRFHRLRGRGATDGERLWIPLAFLGAAGRQAYALRDPQGSWSFAFRRKKRAI